MLVLLTYFTYFSLALAQTPAFSDVCAFAGRFIVTFWWSSPKLILCLDTQAHLAASNASSPYLQHGGLNTVPEPHDVPIGVVNQVLYGPRKYRE